VVHLAETGTADALQELW